MLAKVQEAKAQGKPMPKGIGELDALTGVPCPHACVRNCMHCAFSCLLAGSQMH